jgi:hypothetical protein
VKKRKPIDPRAQLAIAIVGPLLVLAAGWMLVVGPQRAKASDLASQVAATETQVQQAELASRHAPKAEPIRAADIFRLAKAMPDSADMPGIILQLNQVAEESGIQFTSITPHLPVAATGYQTMQIDLSFSGNFYGLSDFLYRLRSLVGVRGGELDATGRLFSVERVSFAEGKPSFPSIVADLTLDAFVYGTPAVPQAAAPVLPGATPDPNATTTTTETAPTDGSTPPPAGASATGATG